MKISTEMLLQKLITGLTIVLFLTFLFSAPAYSEGGEGKSMQAVELVYTDSHTDGEQVFYSIFEKNRWTRPVQISNSSNYVFHPVVSSGPDRKKWVIWAQDDGDGTFLYYSVNNGARWSQARRITTGINDNRSATLVVDKSNTPWLAWTGVEKKYSDVFWSRWHGKGWETPVRAHEENEVPDVEPALALDAAGGVLLSWRTFSSGKYITASRLLKKPSKGLEQMAGSEKALRKAIPKRSDFPEFPSFVKDHKASVFLKTSEGSQSIPLSRF